MADERLKILSAQSDKTGIKYVDYSMVKNEEEKHVA